MCKLLRNGQSVSQSGSTIFHSYQQSIKPSIMPHPCQICYLTLILAILVGMKLYLNVVLICISLMTNNTVHLFMCQ